MPPLVCVGGSGSACHCACFGVTGCFSVCGGVRVAGLWQRVMLSLVVSKPLSVVQLCATVSLYVRQRLRVWPSITTLSLAGVCRSCWGDPQPSAGVLYLLPPLCCCLLLSRSLGGRLVLRRPGSVGRLPHSLCPC